MTDLRTDGHSCRAGRTLRDVAKHEVAIPPYTPERDALLADGWGYHGCPCGLRTQVGVQGRDMCPGTRAGRWSITVVDATTGECGVWDLRELRRELAMEAQGIRQEALL